MRQAILAVVLLLATFVSFPVTAEPVTKIIPYYIEKNDCGVARIVAVTKAGEMVRGILMELNKDKHVSEVIARAREEADREGYTIVMKKKDGCVRS